MSASSDRVGATPLRDARLPASELETQTDNHEARDSDVGEAVDHYRIIRLLGRGGMGRVYLARDTKLGRRVALKMVRHKQPGPRHGALRSLVEARTTARFNHPHIVTIYGVGEHDGWPYLALEYLEGFDLRRWAKERQPGLQEIIRVTHSIALALKEAHLRRILHLDLKPSNVIITREGQAKVVDFGLSRTFEAASFDGDTEVDGSSSEEPIFRAAPGTPAYMAPEQWRGEPLTEATDIWAFGTILYELIAQRRPFAFTESSQDRLSQAVMSDAQTPLLDSSPPIRDLVADCLAKDPQRRPTALDIVRALEQLSPRPKIPQDVNANPFRGFFAFTHRHTELFFGREPEIVEARERLEDEPVLPVIGASGAGKSSFVQAGLIPRLTAENDAVVISLRPGQHPFQTLAARIIGRQSQLSGSSESRTLDRSLVHSMASNLRACPGRLASVLEQVATVEKKRVILFVDQLEELYTLTDDEEIQHRFTQAITHGADDPRGPVRVIFTVRDDFLSRLGKAGAEVRNVLRRVMLLQVPEPQALAETLTGPAQAMGYRFEDPELISRMVDEVGGEPSGLPLLQFAAQAIWDHRDQQRKLLTQAGYEQMGGVTGAFARHADRMLDGLEADELRMAKQLLLRLVTSEQTRKVILREEISSELGPEGARIADRLIDARIVSKTQAGLELAHESLIQTWARLRAWLDENQEELRFLHEIETTVDLWEKRGRRLDEVWTQDALADALRARKRCIGPVAARVDRFLSAGQRKERLRIRRRRVGGAASFLFIALTAVVLFVQRQQAVTEKERAERKELAAKRERAEAQREGAEAAFAKGAVLEARAKLRTALAAHDSVSARFLWGRLEQDNLLWRQKLPSGASPVEISPDGQTIAAGLSNGSVHLYDAETKAVRILQAHDRQVSSIAFSEDGRRLAIGGQGGGLVVWNLENAQPPLHLEGHRRDVYGLAFGKNGRLGSVDLGGEIRLWHKDPLEFEHVIKAGKMLSRIAFDPRDRYFVTTGKALTAWDLETRTPRVLGTHDAMIRNVEISADGHTLVTASLDETIRIWSSKTSTLARTIRPPFVPVAMSITPDGRRIAAGQPSGDIQFFDAQTGNMTESLRGHEGPLLNMTFSRDARRLVSVGSDDTLRFWDVGRPLPSSQPLPHSSGILDVTFSSDTRWVLSGSYDQTARLWDVKTGRVVQVLGEREDGAWSVAISPDHRHLAWGARTLRMTETARPQASQLLEAKGKRFLSLRYTKDGAHLVTARGANISVYDVASKRKIRTFAAGGKRVMDFDLTQNEKHIVTGHVDGSIRVWDFEAGRVLAVWSGKSRVYGVRFDPTGRFVASSSRDGGLRWWDWQEDNTRVIGQHPARTHFMDISPDGQRIAVSSADHSSYIWDVATSTIVFTTKGHREDVNRVRFSPDGRFLVSGGDDETVRLFHAETGRPLWRASALLASSRELVTHRGFVDLDSNQIRPSFSQRWRHALFTKAQRAVEVPGTKWLCLMTYDEQLEIWDRDHDERLSSRPVSHYRDLVALPTGCVISTDHGVRLEHFNKTSISLSKSPARAIGANGYGIVIAHEETVEHHDTQGELLHTWPERDMVAALPSSNGVWVGHRTGRIVRLSFDSTSPRSGPTIVDTPFSPVTRLLEGPGRTLFAGFANGKVAVWHVQNGRAQSSGQLESRSLHGPVSFLVRDNTRIFAATELGGHTVWELAHLEQPWCDLLERVEQVVPVVWSSGRPTSVPAPSSHLCNASHIKTD